MNAIEQWLEKAKVGFENNTKKEWPTCELNWETLIWKKGPKYYRVSHCSLNRECYGGSTYCFIDMEGNIYKSAGRKPAKGIRGHISKVDPEKINTSTGWLYR